jgi:hypothetical protein
LVESLRPLAEFRNSTIGVERGVPREKRRRLSTRCNEFAVTQR